MCLKRIELFGFKSFADKTTIAFEGGVTAIVGPNGCGKSNISDAIRWVLGERSAKLLRGSSMEDLIFSGTEYRKPLGLCEVSLTFDNSKKIFPVQYEEIVLTRRLYRSGESEYLINKTPCRHKDIQSLILDTGVGSNAYSMVEQGRIDYIISAKADERRFLIEEAAGISKYKVNKEEALHKLERTEENLLRINDIVVEVERNIKYAERQARRAERYKRQFDELKQLETVKALREWDALRAKQAELKQTQSALSEQIHTLQNTVSSQSQVASELELKINDFDNTFSLVEEKRYFLKSELTSLNDQIQFHKEKIQELEQSIRQYEGEVKRSTEKMGSLEAQAAEKQRELVEFGTSRQQFEVNFQQEREALEQVRQQCAASEEHFKHLQDRLFAVAAQIAHVKNTLHRAATDQTTQAATQERLRESQVQLGEEEMAKTARRAELKHQADEFHEQISQLEQALGALKTKRQQLVEELESCQSECAELISRKSATESRLQVLIQTGDDGSRLEAGQAILLEESSRENSSICGLVEPFSQKIQIQEGYEAAVRALLGHAFQGLVCSDFSDAKRIVRCLGERGGGAAVLLMKSWDLPSQPVDSPSFPFQAVRALDIVQAAGGYRDAVTALLQGAWIVEKIDHIPSDQWSQWAGRYRFATKQGDVLGPGPLLRIQGSNTFTQTRVQHEEDVGKLRKELDVLEVSFAQQQSKKSRLVDEIRQLAVSLQQLEEELTQKKLDTQQTAQSIVGIEERLAKIRQERQLAESEWKECAKAVTSFERQQGELERQQKELEQEELQLKTQLQAGELQLKELHARKEDFMIKLASLEATYQNYGEREAFLTHALKLHMGFLENERQNILHRTEESTNHRQRIQSLTQENAQLEQKRVQLETEYEQISEEIVHKKAERLHLMNNRNAFSSKLVSLQKELEQLKDSEHKLQLAEMEASYQESAITERMLQTYKTHLQNVDRTVLSRHSEAETSALEEQISELKVKVEDIGTVNLLAVEEYEELKTRYDFLLAQKQDIEQARDALLEAIRKINRTTKKLFEETFAQVQINFQEYFRILFSGGQAQLILMDEQNPLESGIDIVARPPGKKLQNISLLSGGEKALTATALLFALFKIKPSPFSVLDEIDAPLDEANIDRFLAVLRQFLQSTQFIIVTHNRKTIAMADSLYGVTMEEPGVSKIVSVRLGQSDASVNIDLQKEVSTKEVVVN